MEDFVMAKLKHNTKTQFFFLKINLNQNYKKEQKFTKIKEREREREREREYSQFLCGKKYGLNGGNGIKFIQNKMGRKRIKL